MCVRELFASTECLVIPASHPDSSQLTEFKISDPGTNRADSAYSLWRAKEDHMDTTTLLILIIVILLVFGGGWYGRGRWY
jgi:hypothetical protein